MPISKYLSIDEDSITNNKEGTKHFIKGDIFLYDTSTNQITLIKKQDLNDIIDKQENILRHWIQLNYFRQLSNVIIKIFPRLDYLFIR